MDKRAVIVFTGIVLALMVGVSAWQYFTSSLTRQTSVHGVLDLRSWEPSRHPTLNLDGQWEFFPGQLSADSLRGEAVLRSVPDLWTGAEAGGASGQGAGTYRLTIILPEATPPLALRWKTVSSAAIFNVDGRLLGASGRPGLAAGFDRPRYKPQVIRFAPEGRKFVLTVQVSNYEYRSGGLWREVQLGEAEALERQGIAGIVFSFALAVAVTSASFSVIFFYLSRKRRLEYLFFALFAAVVGLRNLVTGDWALLALLPDLDYYALIRIEYATIGLLFVAFALLLVWLFDGPRRLLPLLTGPELGFIALAVFAPLPILTRGLLPLVGIILPQLALLMIRVWLPAWRDDKKSSLALLAGALLIALAGIHDVILTLGHSIADSFVPWVSYFFMFLLSAEMAGHFNRRQRRIETLIADLSVSLLEDSSGIVLVVDEQGSVVKASEIALRVMGRKTGRQRLTTLMKGCPDFKAQWNAMKNDLRIRRNLPGTLGAGRFRLHMFPHRSTRGDFDGAAVRIVPDSTIDEATISYRLTAREKEVSELICKGLDAKRIADALFISLATVKSHIHNVYKKTGAAGKADLLILFFKSSREGEEMPGSF
jgi:DNA-binding CsgD family transcriptional regulator